MITKEPSQPVTPLSNEEEGFPAKADGLTFPPPPTPTPTLPYESRAYAWFEVLKGFIVWVLSVSILLAVPLIITLPYFIYLIWNFGPPRPETIAGDKTMIFISLLGILPAHLLTIALVWVFTTEMGRKPFLGSLNFHWPKPSSPTFTTLLSVLLALALLAIGWAITALWGGAETQLDLLLKSSTAARVTVAFVAVATAPLAEELVYRGVLYSALERATNKAVSIIVVTLLFSGVHVFQYSENIGVIVVITLLSFTLTLARAYTGSVVPPFIIHLVFNGIQALFIVIGPFIEKSFPQKGEELTPTAPGLELAGRLFEAISIYICRMT